MTQKLKDPDKNLVEEYTVTSQRVDSLTALQWQLFTSILVFAVLGIGEWFICAEKMTQLKWKEGILTAVKLCAIPLVMYVIVSGFRNVSWSWNLRLKKMQERLNELEDELGFQTNKMIKRAETKIKNHLKIKDEQNDERTHEFEGILFNPEVQKQWRLNFFNVLFGGLRGRGVLYGIGVNRVFLLRSLELVFVLLGVLTVVIIVVPAHEKSADLNLSVEMEERNLNGLSNMLRPAVKPDLGTNMNNGSMDKKNGALGTIQSLRTNVSTSLSTSNVQKR